MKMPFSSLMPAAAPAVLLGLMLASPTCRGGLASDSGGHLAFSRLSDGQWQVWVMNLANHQSRQLTDTSSDKRFLRSTASPPGLYYRDNQGAIYAMDVRPGAPERKLFAGLEAVKDFDVDPQRGFLISSYAPNAKDNLRIWWFDPSGQGKRLVVGEPYLNESPRWIPGKDVFLFVKSHRGNSAIYRASLAAETSPNLWHESRDPHADPAPSPEGRSVAFCREVNGNFDLWIAGISGERPRAVYQGAGLEADPSWSPEGEWIFFSTWDGSHFRIARIRPNGSDFQYVSPEKVDARYPVMLPSSP